MNHYKIPWADMADQSIAAREPRERGPWMTRAAWAMCIFLIFGGLTTSYHITILFGVLYILVLIMDKQSAVTPRGIEIHYDMKITESCTIWHWKEIHAISREEDPKYPGIYAVYFTKGDRSKRLFFNKDQWDGIIRLARQGNPGLKIAKP